MNHTLSSRWRWLLLFPTAFPLAIRAQVATDGSFGPAWALPGPAFAIPASLGKKVGGNLFHSFSEFSLNQTQSATFTGPADVQNILSRVTGGSPSTIDGLLRSTIQNANFFLLNPNGVMFGPNASVDVTGSFAVVAGDRISLEDGARFNAAAGPADAVLTSAPPAAFGFLGGTPGPISIEGSTLNGGKWALIGGDVQIKDAAMNTTGVVIRGGRLTMDNSKIAVAARNPGDRADVKLQRAATFTNKSSLETTSQTDLRTHMAVNVDAPDMSIVGGSNIASSQSGSASAGSLAIKAGRLTVLDGGGIIANVSGTGTGANMDIRAESILLGGLGSIIGGEASGEGRGGDVRIEVSGKLTIQEDGVIHTPTLGEGAGGNIFISAGTLSMNVFGGISSDAGDGGDPAGKGNAGDIHLNILGALTIENGAFISSESFQAGTGGDISVKAQSLRIVGDPNVFDPTGILANAQQTLDGGRGGNVRLNIAGAVELTSGGQIDAATSGSGAGGSVDIQAGSMRISGEGALALTGITTGTNNTKTAGPGGSIRLKLAGSLDIVAGGALFALTAGPGPGGSIDVAAKSVSISGADSQISVTTRAKINAGRAGDIIIRADSLAARDGATISASTEGSGNGGVIDIAARRIDLDGAQITSETTSPDRVPLFPTVSDLQVSLTIEQQTDANMTVTLIGPDLTRVVLFREVGDNIDVTLSDSAPDSIVGANRPLTGHFRPLNPLSVFDGRPFFREDLGVGQWILEIADPAFNRDNPPKLTAWSLTNRGTPIVAVDIPDVLQFFPVTLPSPFDPSSTSNFSYLLVTPGLLPPPKTVTITPGKSGDVRIAADMLKVTNGAQISAQTLNSSRGGDILLNVTKQLQITDSGLITASTLLSGKGGNVSLDAGNLFISTGGRISAATAGTGAGGTIDVNADSIVISKGDASGAALISAESTNTGEGGRGGDISIAAGSLKINGASDFPTGISARSLGAGESGSVRLQLGTLTLDSSAFIGSSNEGTGNAGSVRVRADGDIFMRGGGVISVSATRANAGDIDIASATRIDLREGAAITASAGLNGGSITIAAPDFIHLIDSSITAKAGAEKLANAAGGAGGNISIDPEFMVLDHSVISANAAIGRGGNIFLQADNFLSSETSITATGTTAGTVEIVAPELDLSAALIILPNALVDASRQLREQCARRLGLDFSSFLVIGRGGLDLGPEDPLPSGPVRKRR